MGKDVFAILPTGYGKSLCYASLPVLLDHLHQPKEKSIVIVVTPLTAIMEDQASQST
jgi:ATP-dependent DNA helicase RecQ